MDNNSIFEGLNNFADLQTPVSPVDPLSDIRTDKSFDEISVFASSPFGRNWDKRFVLADWEKDKYRDDPPQRQWIYHLERSADGKKLIDLYQHDNIISNIYGSDTDELTDISIYYETDDNYNTFGSVCFAKMNGALEDYLRKYSTARKWLVDEIVKKESTKIDAIKLREAVDYELDEGGGMDIVAKIGAKLLLKLGEIIRDSKYKENVWNPELENYDPIIPIIGIDGAVKKWNSFKKSADSFFAKAKDAGEWIAENIPIVGEFIQSCIDILADIFSSIINAVDEVIQFVNKILRIIKLVNAFIAGVINECIEMTAGLMDLAALSLTLTNKIEREKVRESLENILESYRKEPSKIITQLKEAFASLQERYSSDKSGYQIAYQLGEDAVTVVAWIELINGIIKALKNLPKTLKKLEAWTEKSIQRIKAIEFSKIGEQLKVLRFKYIDRTMIRTKWRIFVKYSELSKSRIIELQKLRQEYDLLYDNIATLKIRAVTEEGIIIIKDYTEQSGKGAKVPGSEGAPQTKKTQREFIDYKGKKKTNRWRDSENRILLRMDRDLEPYNIVEMKMEWESTFIPCTICKREILIRKELYNAKVVVKSPKFKNKKGKKIHVVNSPDFKELLNQLK